MLLTIHPFAGEFIKAGDCCDRKNAEAEHATTLKNNCKVVLATVPYRTGEKR
jgi:hypothetical protein